MAMMTSFPDSRATRSASVAPSAPAPRDGAAAAPVVMLHSSLASRSQWGALAARLAPRHDAIPLDLCGYGEQPMPATRRPFTLDDEVQSVAARVDRLLPSGTRFHLVGHSYGGAVALRYAQRHGERVASLALYDPVAFSLLDGTDGLGELAAEVARLVDVHRYHEATRAFVDFWSGEGQFVALPLPVQARLARRIAKVPLDFAAARSAPLRLTDCRSIMTPALVLGGTHSPAVAQRIVAALADALPDVRTAWIDAGHMGPVTDGLRINALFEAFIDACASRDLARPAAVAEIRQRRCA